MNVIKLNVNGEQHICQNAWIQINTHGLFTIVLTGCDDECERFQSSLWLRGGTKGSESFSPTDPLSLPGVCGRKKGVGDR